MQLIISLIATGDAEMQDHHDETDSLAWYRAVEDISYLGNTLSRWAISARVARISTHYMKDQYIELLMEDAVKLEAALATLRASLQVSAAASVQYVSHETQGVAA